MRRLPCLLAIALAAVSASPLAAHGKTPQQATLAEMDALWDEAKANESSHGKMPRSGTSR